MKLKVLYYDIETAPLLARIWSPYQKFVSHQQMVHDSFMLTYAGKWSHENRVRSDRLTSREALDQNDERIVVGLAKLVREADIIIAHNINGFDLPRLNGRVMMNGLEPLGPVQTIDTLTLARKNFGFAYNKLDWLAEQFGFGTKIDTDMDLWHRAYLGDASALKEMERYNKHDVVLLEKVFEFMKPHVQRLTRLFDADRDGQWICLYCGTEGPNNFQMRGYVRTQGTTFHKVQCKNTTCRKYGRVRVSDTTKRGKVFPL